MNRRQALAVLGASAAAPALVSSVSWTAHATEHEAITQVAGVQHLRVGDAVVTALLDGAIPIGADAFAALSDEEANALLREAFLPGGPTPTAVNAYVLRDAAGTTLIDAGGGDAFPGLGGLTGALDAAGIAAEDVDTILVTHLHPDHIGGLVGANGAAFPNARLRVHEAEIAFWTDPANRDAAPEAFRSFFDLAQAVLDAYGDRVEPFSEDGTVRDGVASQHLPGHTPGHTGFRIGSGEDALLVWGDIVHVGPFQFPRPDLSIGFDVDPELAARTRADVFARVAEARTRVAGMHLSFPGVGHVAPAGDGYRFVPEPWTYRL
jgi:glyoxylase-like metal-dependent hydrolase (beta-lactamase superfamily II)